MLSSLTSVGLFSKYSPKRQRQLEKCIDTYNDSLDLEEGTTPVMKTKLKTMCQTRWVERHTCMQDFDCMYSALYVCLDEIAKNTDMIWDGKAVTEAQGSLHNISSPGFIAAFKVNIHMFGYTKPLSCLLQGSAMDVITAYNEIHTVKKILNDIRKDPAKEFKPVFESMLAMSEIAGSAAEMPIPRTCGRQTARSNVEALSPEEYWCRTVFIPFLDHLIQEFVDRFSQLNEDAIKGLQLLPKNVSKLSAEDTHTICQHFRTDLPSPQFFSQEVRRWKVLWSPQPTELPSTLRDTLHSQFYVPKSYPNIATILHILSVTPVTASTTDRANSALKFIKSDRRSTMGQDRLNSLLLLCVHKDIQLNYDAVVDLYASRIQDE